MGDLRLEGKVAIVTGANAGIGACTAELLAANGAAVVLTDLRTDTATALVEKIEQSGGRALAAPCDVRVDSQVQSVVDRAIAAFGQIDVLVNNAGIMDRHMATVRTTNELWDRVLATDLTGVFYFCRAVLPHMERRGTGSIINVGAIGGVYMNAGAAYSAAKAGVNALTKNIALQYSGTGIRCNSVNPGPTTTTMFSPEVLATCDREFQDTCFKHVCLDVGLSDPIDQAEAILFLASDEARYITGQWLVVDRGACL